MKKFIRVLSLLCILAITMPFFAACSPQRQLEKVAKGLSSYSMDLNVVDEETVEASMLVKAVNTSHAELDRLMFNLYPRAFREGASIYPYTSLNEGKCFPAGKSYGNIEIKSVAVNGQQGEVKYAGADENALEVELGQVLEPSKSVEIAMDFTLRLPECTHRFGHYGGSINLGNFYPILAVYENGEFNVTPYYATGDPFYSELANYSVKINYPKGFYLSSTGQTISEEDGEACVVASLASKATRDFAICLTAESQVKSCEQEGVKISYVGYSADQDCEAMLDVCKMAVSYFSKTFGDYPYPKLDVVKAPFVHGGMEYPEIVIISDSINEPTAYARVIVHEIAHQWWYAVVGSNEISEAWLDESLAEYSSVLFFEAHPEFGLSYEQLVSEAFAGYVLYADIVKSLSSRVNTSMLLKVNEYNGEYEYSYMVYVKGVLMFDSLRELCGKDKVEKGFKKYYSAFKFKTATTDQFIACFSKAAGRDIEGFFDSWLQGKVIIGTL